MKYIIVGIGTIILLGVVVFSLPKIKTEKEIKDIKLFHYGTTDGMAMYDGVRYEIDYEDDKFVATIQKNGQSDEEAKRVEISKEKVKELEDILNKYEVSKWDGFKKSDKNVLDGHSFSLYIRLFDDTSIDASGYMKWPKNYSEVRGSLESYFESL